MRAIGIAVAAAALMGLTGCDQLGIAGKAESNVSANAGEAPANMTGEKPRGDIAAATGDGDGLGGKEPAGAIWAGAGTEAGGVAVDRAYILGRWTDTGDCDNAVDFGPDGRFVAFDGTVGQWTISGDRLTISGDPGLTLQIVPVDQNRITVINPDGSQGQSTRC